MTAGTIRRGRPARRPPGLLTGVILAWAAAAQAQTPGVEALELDRATLHPGESTRLTVRLRAPAGPNHTMVLHAPRDIVPMDFTATPGWRVTVPPGERTVTVTIQANPNATPAFGGPFVDLRPDYDPGAPTRRLTIVAR